MRSFIKFFILIAITAMLWSCIKDDSVDIINRHTNDPDTSHHDTTQVVYKTLLTLHVINESNQIVSGAEVSLYHTPQAYAGDTSLASGPVLTDSLGNANFKKLGPQIYYFWVTYAKKYNSFTQIKLDSVLDTSRVKVVTVQIKPLTPKELVLSTDSIRSWKVTSIVTPYITIPNVLITTVPEFILTFKSNGTYANQSSGGSFLSLGSGFWTLASDASSFSVVKFDGSGATTIPLTQLNKWAMIASMSYGGISADLTFEIYTGK